MSSDIVMIDSPKIRIRMAMRGLSRNALALETELSPGTIRAALLSGHCRTRTAVCIYSALGRDPMELLGDSHS